MEKSKKKQKKFLLDMIENVRKSYSELTDEELKFLQLPSDFRDPCQIEVFWINKPIEFQIVITRRDSDLEDKQIIINGPYSGKEFLDEISTIMSEDRWTKEIEYSDQFWTYEKETSYADAFASIFASFLDTICNSVFTDYTGNLSGISISDKAWCQLIRGNILDWNVEKIIRDNISNIKYRTERPLPIQSPVNIQKKKHIKGYGAFFYPKIWLGKRPPKNFLQKALRTVEQDETVVRTTFNNKLILVTSKGFVGIQGVQKDEAINILNSIFGISLLLGMGSFAIRESEIADVEIDTDTQNMNMKWNADSLRTYPESYLRFPPNRREISIEKMNEILSLAESICSNKELMEKIVFFLEGNTYFRNSDYPQSFIMNWIIVEKYLNDLWEGFVESKTSSKKRKNTLTKYSTSLITEILNLYDILSDEHYYLINELRTIRNNFIHEGKSISKGNARKLLNLSISIIKEDLKILQFS